VDANKIVMDLWDQSKAHQKFERTIMNQLDYFYRLFANAPRQLSQMPPHENFKKGYDKINQAEHQLAGSVVKYKKIYQTITNHTNNVKKHQEFISSHTDPILLTNGENHKSGSFPEFSLNKETLSILETNLNLLLNLCDEYFNKLNTSKKGIKPEKIETSMKFINSIRDCAEKILNLSIAYSLQENPKLNINPVNPVIIHKDKNIKNICSGSNIQLALNNQTINKIIELYESKEKLVAINRTKEIQDILLELQKHEMSLQLNIQFTDYENNILIGLLNGLLKTLEKSKLEINQTFEEFGLKFKSKLIHKLDVFFLI